MALTQLKGGKIIADYVALSSDVSASKIAGLTQIGAIVYFTDDFTWHIVLPDNTLAVFKMPITPAA